MSRIEIEFIEPSIPGIEVLGFNHGFVQPDGRSGRGPVEPQNLTFTKYGDEHSPALMRFCWSGKQFQSAVLTMWRDDPHVRSLVVRMKNVVISNFSISGGAGDVPVENVSLDYGSIAYEYVSPKGVSSATPEMTKESAG